MCLIIQKRTPCYPEISANSIILDLVVLIITAAVLVHVRCLSDGAFPNFPSVRVSVKGEAEVETSFNPFPSVLDLRTSKTQILRSEQSECGIGLHCGDWIGLVQSE